MVTDGSYLCGEHSRTHRNVESLCFTPKTNVILCTQYYTQVKKKRKRKGKGFACEKGKVNFASFSTWKYTLINNYRHTDFSTNMRDNFLIIRYGR